MHFTRIMPGISIQSGGGATGDPSATSTSSSSISSSSTISSPAVCNVRVDHQGSLYPPCGPVLETVREIMATTEVIEDETQAAALHHQHHHQHAYQAAATATMATAAVGATMPSSSSISGGGGGGGGGAGPTGGGGGVNKQQPPPHPHPHLLRRKSTNVPWTTSAIRASTAVLKLNCGLLAGVTQAGIFNPWDRALYLSVKHTRPFLSSLNFQRPYQGFGQAIVQRTLSTGLYFPLEDMCMGPCREYFGGNNFLAAWMAGNLAGAVNGIALNPASAIKYHTWGRDNASFWRTAQLMWRDGGIQPFLKGTSPTIMRDLIFGGVYSSLRNGLIFTLEEYEGPDNALTPTQTFILNVVAAGLATTVSGPFNYVRNIKYSFPADITPPSSAQILRDVWKEMLAKPTFWERCSLMQDRLRIGWGTARVAVGMAFTNHIYQFCKNV